MTSTTPTVEKPLPQREQRRIPPALPTEPLPNPLANTGARLKTSVIPSPTHMTDSNLDSQESSARDTDKESSNRNESQDTDSKEKAGPTTTAEHSVAKVSDKPPEEASPNSEPEHGPVTSSPTEENTGPITPADQG